jgi:hypothetical protein
MQDQSTIGFLQSGEAVVDRHNSQAKVNGIKSDLLRATLSRIDSKNEAFLIGEVSFEHAVGLSACLVTSPGDDIIWAERRHRQGLTRFARGNEPLSHSPCMLVYLPACTRGATR